MVISMEEALGLSKDPKVDVRRRRVFELRCRGLTIPAIYEKLREEGIFACEKTIWSDLHSDQLQGFIEELLRRQFADMELSGSYKLKLEYRDRILDKMMPSKPENSLTVNVTSQSQSNVKVVSDLLAEYREVIAETAASSRHLSANDSSESLDPCQANPKAGKISSPN